MLHYCFHCFWFCCWLCPTSRLTFHRSTHSWRRPNAHNNQMSWGYVCSDAILMCLILLEKRIIFFLLANSETPEDRSALCISDNSLCFSNQKLFIAISKAISVNSCSTSIAPKTLSESLSFLLSEKLCVSDQTLQFAGYLQRFERYFYGFQLYFHVVWIQYNAFESRW